jgi:hypothetical protein
VTPNIFNYATSELSQDAFFCWLLEWSKDEYAMYKLNKISLGFINYIMDKAKKDKIDIVKEIDIKRQNEKIDFYVKINNTTIILFEDKTGTKPHDNQLIRYKKSIEKKYKDYQLVYVYLKSDIVWKSERKEIMDADYIIIDISGLVNIFLGLLDIFENKNSSDNDLFDDYFNYIVSKSKTYDSFRILPYSKWNDNAWLGFYAYLEHEINTSGIGNWAGGLKTWLTLAYLDKGYESEIDDLIEVCLTLDKNKIIIDALDIETTKISEYQEYLQDKIGNDPISAIDDFHFVEKQGNGKKIRIAVIENIFIFCENEIIDVEKTLNKIKDITQKFHECFSNGE